MRTLLIVLMLLSFASETNAQKPTVLQPGSLVRVWSSELPKPKFTGVVHMWTAHSLTLQARGSSGEEIEISRASISCLDVRRQLTSSQALAWGALVGGLATLGPVLLFKAMAGEGGEWTNSSVPYLTVAGGAALGAVTFVVLRGTLADWRRVPLDSLSFGSRP
jgi:hypothetical protein